MKIKTNFSLLSIVLIFASVSCYGIKKDTASSNEDALYSTIISKNGQIIFEDYYNGKTKDSLCDVQSLTKGIISILVGIAIDKGYIKNVDEPIESYFPEEFKTLTDKRKSKITIKHILNQTSGLAWEGYLEHEAWLKIEDPISYVLQKKLEYEPGKAYNYNSGATHLLSVIISRATGKTTLEFANEVLFTPLDINQVDWQKRNKDHYDGSGLGLKMKPIDLMKIGQLLEKKGTWNDTILISEQWIEKLFDGKEKSATKWGLRNSIHGFCWYQSKFEGNNVNYGMGYGGQFIIMIPDKKLMIVTIHNADTPDGIEQQVKFLNDKLPKLIQEYGK